MQRSSFALAVLASGAPAAAQCELFELAPGGSPPGHYGTAVAIDGDTLVVGAQRADVAGPGTGAVLIFEKGAQGWQETQVLTASGAGTTGNFGHSVALDGDTLLVGAPCCSALNPCFCSFPSSGAYFFERGPSGWVETQEFLRGGVFGFAVALDGDTAVIGELSANEPYIFERSGGAWSETARLVASGWTFRLGMSVAIFGDTVIAGGADDHCAPTFGDYCRSFERGPSGWTETDDLHFVQAPPLFGFSVALGENKALVGAPGFNSAGRVYSFIRSGSSWTNTGFVQGSGAGTLDRFGSAVALKGTTVAVGAPANPCGSPSDPGAVYIYDFSFAFLQHTATIETPLAMPQAFGRGVGIDGETVVTGAPGHDFSSTPGNAFTIPLGPLVSTYCTTSPNSVGSGALIGHFGTVSIADNTFTVRAGQCSPNQFGIFFYGLEQTSVPFGNGARCVGPGSNDIHRLTPPQPTDAQGNLQRLVDFTSPPAGMGPGQITPGSTWNFQLWYRDPAGGGAFFNLSDALHATFCP